VQRRPREGEWIGQRLQFLVACVAPLILLEWLLANTVGHGKTSNAVCAPGSVLAACFDAALEITQGPVENTQVVPEGLCNS
jgi:hypothetical protein